MNGQIENETEAYLANFLEAVLADRTAESAQIAEQPIQTYGAGHIGPTFWADAPWRLEPAVTQIPFTFIIRDAEKDEIKMRLEAIEVYEAADDGKPWKDKAWRLVHTFDQGLGPIDYKYWTYRPDPKLPSALGAPPEIALERFIYAKPGHRLPLRIRFKGSRLKGILGRRDFEEWLSLSIYLATESLPLRDSPQWYYGDTHYHSSYTADVKEFGNPVPDTRAAGKCIGLDWLAITDHSVDLADRNPYWEDKQSDTRWDELGREVSEQSDDQFRIVRGEEVTLLGREGEGDDTLHMLVFGAGFDKLIPGAFAKKSLLAGVVGRLSGYTQELYKHLFGPVYRLEEVLTGVDKNGEAVPALAGRSVQKQKAIAFAAHPAAIAQSPGGIWEYEDLLQPIQGLEAWNGRIRFTTGKEESPFEHWKDAINWDESNNKKGIDLWDQMLRVRVGLDDPRFVLLAGTDAHGSFNYSLGWWVDWDGIRADDNCLGKVRTIIYVPEADQDGDRLVPTVVEIIGAMQSGSCIVSDGPVLNLAVGFNGKEVGLGEVMSISGDGDLTVTIQAASTKEFGPVENVEVIYYFQDMDSSIGKMAPYRAGHTQVLDGDLPVGSGYIRLATSTAADSDTFRCFTNPVWLKSDDRDRRRLVVNCVDWS